MSVRKAEILLITSVACRAISFIFSKIALGELEPFNLMAIRFLSAAFLLSLIFHKKILAMTRRTFFHGMLIGLAYFMVMTFELHGLRYTEAGTASFLENTAIVFVPLMLAVINRRLPARTTWISAGSALIGVGFLTLGSSASAGLSLGRGELLCLCAALSYTSGMVLTDRITGDDDPVTIGILQIGFIGLFAVPATFMTETPKLPELPETWLMLACLVFISSVIGFTLLPVAQHYLPAERVSLFCALAPVVACTSGVIFLHEEMTPAKLAGAILILTALVAPKLTGNVRLRRFTDIFHSDRRFERKLHHVSE